MPQKSNKTLVTLLLDRSGSMEEIRDETIEAVNSYISHLKDSQDDIRLSLALFDSPFPGTEMKLEKIFVAKKVDKVQLLTRSDFAPRGGTPLLDAVATTILAVEESLIGKTAKVVLAIQTDGDERHSKDFSWNAVKAMISAKEKAGWQVNFLGAGINAYKQGERLGISRAQTLSYGVDREATRNAFAATAAVTRGFASGAMATTSYSSDHKLSAGDLWTDK